MSYLYGDSTPSALRSNFIDFLRDAVECAVQVLAADEHVRSGVEKVAELRKQSEVEVTRLEALGATVSKAVDGAQLGDGGSPTANCAEAILRATVQEVQAEIGRVHGSVKTEADRLEAQAARERANCVQVLSWLILKHDLPEWTYAIHLEQMGGTRYAATMQVTAPWGLTATIELEIPPSHLMAHVLRVDKVAEKLEVQAPEAGGWIRKEVKLRPQPLHKEYVTSVHIDGEKTMLTLRANADGTGAGCDLGVKAPKVHLTRENDQAPFELADGDAQRVIEFHDKVIAACRELMSSRKAMIAARLDGTPLAEHQSPRLLAERLIETITPTVQEIARRSLSPNELVLKRQLDTGRREEIFISRAELKDKLNPLGEAQRALFAPLGLADAPPPPPAIPWKPSPSSILSKPLLAPIDDEPEQTVVDAKPK